MSTPTAADTNRIISIRAYEQQVTPEVHRTVVIGTLAVLFLVTDFVLDMIGVLFVRLDRGWHLALLFGGTAAAFAFLGRRVSGSASYSEFFDWVKKTQARAEVESEQRRKQWKGFF